jgi:hypothetical protein
VQLFAHEPPFVVTHVEPPVGPAQQSSLVVHALLATAHVAEQKPRGAQAIVLVLTNVVQQSDSQSVPVVQGAAHADGSPIANGSRQMPEQHAFGVLVQLAPTARQTFPLSTFGTPESWPVLAASTAPESTMVPASMLVPESAPRATSLDSTSALDVASVGAVASFADKESPEGSASALAMASLPVVASITDEASGVDSTSRPVGASLVTVFELPSVTAPLSDEGPPPPVLLLEPHPQIKATAAIPSPLRLTICFPAPFKQSVDSTSRRSAKTWRPKDITGDVFYRDRVARRSGGWAHPARRLSFATSAGESPSYALPKRGRRPISPSASASPS